jgi:hypothetical protein
MQSITLEDQLCSEDENDTLTPVREIVDSTSDDASLNLENIADTDEFLDDVLQEADFMEGIRPLDISVDDEKWENVRFLEILLSGAKSILLVYTFPVYLPSFVKTFKRISFK